MNVGNIITGLGLIRRRRPKQQGWHRPLGQYRILRRAGIARRRWADPTEEIASSSQDYSLNERGQIVFPLAGMRLSKLRRVFQLGGRRADGLPG